MDDFYAPKGMQIIFILITVERLARFIRLSVSRIRAEKKQEHLIYNSKTLSFFIKQRAGYMHPSNSIEITTR